MFGSGSLNFWTKLLTEAILSGSLLERQLNVQSASDYAQPSLNALLSSSSIYAKGFGGNTCGHREGHLIVKRVHKRGQLVDGDSPRLQ
jgi:hypothetical protein